MFGGSGYDGKATPPVVVYKGGYRDCDGGGGSGVDSPRRDFAPYRDSRTLTWDRNPRPDRSDPKYFPVNSLPRQQSNGSNGGMGPPRGVMDGDAFARQDTIDSVSSSMPPPMRELSGGYPPVLTPREESRYQEQASQPGPQPPTQPGDFFSPGSDYYDPQANDSNAPGRGQRLLQRMASDPARYRAAAAGRFASQQAAQSPTGVDRRSYTLQYPGRGHSSGGGGGYTPQSGGGGRGMDPQSSRARHYSGMDYASDTEALQSPSSVSRMSRSSVYGVRGAGGLAAPAPSPASGVGGSTRSSSLPRTFQREALLRHPELSMEMDRLAADPAGVLSGLSTDDGLSDSGAVSESAISARKRGRATAALVFSDATVIIPLSVSAAGYRSPSSLSQFGPAVASSPHDPYVRGRSSLGHIYGGSGAGTPGGTPSVSGVTARLGLTPTGTPGMSTDIRRTPSTSAIYETLRRSKELRESLSRPSSRLSVENERINVSDLCELTSADYLL